MSRRHAFMVCFLGFMENFGEQMQRANRTKEKGTVSAATKSEPLDQFEVGEGTKGGETARDGEVAPMLVAGKRQSDDSSSNGIAGAVAPIPSPSCRCRVPPGLRRPLKMALTLTVASLWFVVPVLQDHFQGVWVTVTVCFVSQSDVGSSLIKCFNRLIGTHLLCLLSGLSAAVRREHSIRPDEHDGVRIRGLLFRGLPGMAMLP